MAKIVINNNISVNGKLTVDRCLNEDKKSFTINGVLCTHLYFEEINSIETSRYILSNVEVQKESFGSDDYNVYYYFLAESLEVQGTLDKETSAVFFLYGEEMKAIEDEMYKNDHPLLGDIGPQYKNFIRKDEEEEGDEE